MRWPGLRIVDGPPLPIVSDVAVFAANIGVPLRLAENGAAEFPWEVDIEVDSWPSTSSRSIVATDDGWTGDGVDVSSGVVSAGKWTLALDDDVGALVGLRRVRGRAFARPLGLRRRGRITSVWMMVDTPFSWGLVDDEGFHRVTRLVGASIALLAQSAQSASVDPPLAKAIAVACDTRGAA